MNLNRLRVFRNLSVATWVAAVLGACATNFDLPAVNERFARGEYEEGIRLVEQSKESTPLEVRARSTRYRDMAVNALIAQAAQADAQGDLVKAEQALERALKIDPNNGRALQGKQGLAQLRRAREVLRAAEAKFKAGDLEGARVLSRQASELDPNSRDARALARQIDVAESAKREPGFARLNLEGQKPLTLEFRDAPLRAVFEVVSRESGINMVFDRDVRSDLKATVFLKDVKLEDAVRLLLVSNQLESKVLNHNTLLIYPNTPAKQREYQELLVKSFYLTNADVKQTQTMLKTLAKTRDVFIDEKLGLVIVRDTPDAVRMAEKLIALHDLAEPEVLIEVEVLEIANDVGREVGVKFPDQIGYSSLVGAAGTAGTVTLTEWLARSAGLVRFTLSGPLALLTLRGSQGTSNILANPRVRVKNREKAKIHIGDRVPVITTTAAATGSFVSETVTYLDVGLKLEVEPNVYLDDDIGIKVNLEVSSIVREILGTNNNSRTYQIGTRNASTVLRLRDGETQVLGGLIQDEDRRTATRVPGIGELPVVGRLFSTTNDTSKKNEIILLMTPRIVRGIVRPSALATEFSGGTDAALGAAPLSVVPTRGPSVPSASLPSISPTPAPSVNVLRPNLPSPLPPGFPVTPAPAPGATPSIGGFQVPAPPPAAPLVPLDSGGIGPNPTAN